MNQAVDLDELTLFRDMARRAFEQEITPHYETWEEERMVPRTLWNRLGEAGLLCPEMEELPRERLGIAAQAVAASEGALNITAQYVQEREAFGQKIGQFQNTRFKLADVKTDIAINRAFYEQCAREYAEGTLTPDTAAMLKLASCEMQCRVADQCLQLFGGYGYTSEYPISRFYVDARIQTIYGGSSEIMRELVARSILGR